MACDVETFALVISVDAQGDEERDNFQRQPGADGAPDDSHDDANRLDDKLRGIAVEQAGDAASALRTVTTSTPFDLVVMDLRLPDMKDLSLLGTIRQLLPSAMLVLMTAFGTPEIITAAQALGATVLNKPFELDALKRIANGPEA